jgi:hypothetical protein
MPDGDRSANASVAPRWKFTPKTPPQPKIPTSKRLSVTGPVTHTPGPSVFARLLDPNSKVGLTVGSETVDVR